MCVLGVCVCIISVLSGMGLVFVCVCGNVGLRICGSVDLCVCVCVCVGESAVSCLVFRVHYLSQEVVRRIRPRFLSALLGDRVPAESGDRCSNLLRLQSGQR
jgi:hypothetical protein